jgi:rod shape determining protein RodA
VTRRARASGSAPRPTGGARSWIGIAGFGGQPSDFAKLGTAILLARYLGGLRQLHLDVRHLLVAGLIVALPVSLIALQPDLGGAAMFGPIYLGMVLVAGVRGRLIATVLLVTLAVGAAVWTFGMRDYQRDRIASFVSPERDPLGAGYQVRQSKIAVGSGALLGKGYGQGTQSQLRFLPARHTDFVFAVLAEEWGFLGVSAVLALYAVFLGTGLRIAARARNRSGVLLASRLLAALAAHVLYNTGLMIGLVPVTGIPLPVLSYGGSFMLFCFFVTGLLLGVDLRRYVNRF